MIMVRLRGFYLRRKILTTEDFDSCDQHCFFIKLNTAIILAYMHDNTNIILVLYYAWLWNCSCAANLIIWYVFIFRVSDFTLCRERDIKIIMGGSLYDEHFLINYRAIHLYFSFDKGECSCCSSSAQGD